MRIPEDLAESMLEQAYSDRPFELLAWALGYACRILEALTDEETAMTFNKESSALLTELAKKKMREREKKETPNGQNT